jgi:hypothetical protein
LVKLACVKFSAGYLSKTIKTLNMKYIKISFVLLALVFAVTTAFTKKQEQEKYKNPYTYLVWFEVDRFGFAINPLGGQPGQNPFGCSGSSVFCSRALTYHVNPALSEVIELFGIYIIKPGVDIFCDYDDAIWKDEE